jgi:RNase P subunit RPR2
MAAPEDFRVQIVFCDHCGRRFGIAAATGMLSTERLPDPFTATCIHCGKQADYPKAAIQNLPINPNN